MRWLQLVPTEKSTFGPVIKSNALPNNALEPWTVRPPVLALLVQAGQADPGFGRIYLAMLYYLRSVLAAQRER